MCLFKRENKSTWKPPEGHSLIDAGNGSPGDTWDGRKFIKPVLPEPEPVGNLVTEMDDLKTRIEKLEKK